MSKKRRDGGDTRCREDEDETPAKTLILDASKEPNGQQYD
jgi:hypothetical protein